MFLSRLTAVLIAIAPFAASAHEFWIEPDVYQVETGGRLQAHFKNGQAFKGVTLSFFGRSSERFDVIVDGKAVPVIPRDGDSPALDIDAPIKNGLVSVVHETSSSLITYREWEKFQKFSAHKNFQNAEADHLSAGWSQVKFRERYTRHVKALIAVGRGEGSDSTAGLKVEFVALTNPYLDAFDNNMKVSLLYDGTARAGAQVEVFERAPDDTVTITLHNTDADGTASIPVKSGHVYLFDTVVLRPAPEASSEENAIVWETFWAALTFKVPE